MSSRDKNLVIVRSDRAVRPRPRPDRSAGCAAFRAPKSRPRARGAAVRERILQLRRQLSAAGADTGPETITWYLQKKRPRSSYIPFEADLPNEYWQAGITHCFLADGTRLEVLDCHDVLHARTAPAFTGPKVVAALQELIDEHGSPASTLIDESRHPRHPHEPAKK